jgi:non-heme chloroperoxidase
VCGTQPSNAYWQERGIRSNRPKKLERGGKALPYIEVESGIRVFVEDINPNGNPTVIFIHGWPVNHQMFEYQFDQLPRYGFRCIGLDLRGFGKSDRPWTGYSYDRLADDVRVVIETLCLQDVMLVGFSIGGAIAIRYMARHAGYGVSKLVLLAAAAPVFTRRPDYPYGLPKEEVNALIHKTLTDRPQMLGEFGRMFFASQVSQEFSHWFHSLGLEASGHGTAMGLVSLRDEDLRNDLSAINVPTGIFHGVHDQIVPFPSAVALNQMIAHSEFYRFEFSGHGLFYDELEKFNACFIQFLNK